MSRFLIASCVVLLAMPVVAQQQQNSSAPPPRQQQKSSSSAQKKSSRQNSAPKPSSAEENPFPEAQSEAAAKKAQQQQEQEEQDSAPSAPAPQPQGHAKQKPSAADRNPFPEQQSEKAARQDEQQSPSGSSSGRGYSSSQSGLQGLDLPKTNEDARPLLNPGLAKKDTAVGMFYLKTADYKGAYDRFLEATRIDPTNADAVFGLAESARHLNLRDQAIRNYQLYLSALPDGPRAKASRKALKDLGVRPNS